MDVGGTLLSSANPLKSAPWYRCTTQKYVDLLTYAESTHAFDPQQQANLPEVKVRYVSGEKAQSVILEHLGMLLVLAYSKGRY